ncbi:Ig-like domain-containing protein [Pyxidicoccus sp. MSG2]|uniref:Ig-like domain-containing protein n=1 Tax=Pyxidicoccus sp. MSG2 TaxID=2996790 RepID=UPI00226FAC7A|nr:Ig-like domain-containing protein [Pyxidicoccus sp. MSG2]MCY1022517.1 Ig-like domain-containing protein [Pyxidicoccus sp. MSG2]
MLALLVALAACSDSNGGDDDADAGSDNAKVDRIIVTPDQGFLWVGERLTLAAFAYDRDGTLLEDVSFTWSGTDATVAGVEDGRVEGVSSGASLVTASAGDVSSSPVAVLVIDAPEDMRSSDEYLAEAAEAGLVTPHEVLTYRVYAAFKDSRLPLQYKGRASGAFETEALQDVIDQYETLPAETKAALDPFLVPPADGASWLAPPGSGQGLSIGRPTCKSDTDGWVYVNSNQAKVNVWYQFTIPGQKEKAKLVSEAIEKEIWPRLFDVLGFPEPLSDADSGCSNYGPKLDVFLVRNVDFRGLTVPELGAPYQSSVFIMLNESLTPDELKAGAAHELMHASHWAFRTKSFQTSYGWLRDAVANWAIDAVYGKTLQLEQDFANCYLRTPELPLQDRAKGHCDSSKSDVERDYGAYLWLQYISNTYSPSMVKSILAATQSVDTGVEAIDNVVPGGFQKHWPLFGKMLWNQAPVDTKPASFATWDTLNEPVKSVDTSGDLGGAAEKKDELEPELKNLSHRVYHFDFQDPATHSVLFYNGFFEPKKAGKHVKVQALWLDGNSAWQEEDWSDYEFVGLCRDIRGQRVQHLVIILSNAETEPGGSVTATRTPYLKRNNIGCWKIQGTVNALTKQPGWTGMGRQGVVTVGFELDAAATALDFKHPQFPDTLRLGANMLMSPSGTFFFEVAYGSGGCSNRFGPASFNIAPFSGFLQTNPFPELHSPDATVTEWLKQPARAYVGALVDNSSIAEVVSGLGCDSPEYTVPGGLLVTNDEKNGVYVNPPQVLPDGSFVNSFSESGFTFDWIFTPQRQP